MFYETSTERDTPDLPDTLLPPRFKFSSFKKGAGRLNIVNMTLHFAQHTFHEVSTNLLSVMCGRNAHARMNLRFMIVLCVVGLHPQRSIHFE
jgi:hypothetical protein